MLARVLDDLSRKLGLERGCVRVRARKEATARDLSIRDIIYMAWASVKSECKCRNLTPCMNL
jgi:hypothetical protein